MSEEYDRFIVVEDDLIVSKHFLRFMNAGLDHFKSFEKVEKATGDSSYQPDPSRLLSITLTQARNTRYNSQSTASEILRDPAVSYPFTFEAVITQKFPDKDPLALPTEKPF